MIVVVVVKKFIVNISNKYLILIKVQMNSKFKPGGDSK
jgi:hypothetical protein